MTQKRLKNDPLNDSNTAEKCSKTDRKTDSKMRREMQVGTESGAPGGRHLTDPGIPKLHTNQKNKTTTRDTPSKNHLIE